MSSQYMPVPYNMDFELVVMAKVLMTHYKL